MRTALWAKDKNINMYAIGAGVVAGSVGVDGLTVNLTVVCERDVARMYFSSGDLEVSSLRAAQECTVLNTNETKYQVAIVTNHNRS